MDLELHAGDGTPLAARLFLPSGRPRGAVLVAGAMGVPQRFYAPLGTWLAKNDFAALTFDYRGIGASRRGPLAEVTGDLLTWAEQDTPAAVDALTEHVPDAPLTWLGHSLGGQLVPFVPNRERAAKIVTVAAGSGYWRDNAPALKRKVWIFWWGAVPLATPLFGYFPGKRLGMVGDLPKGVIAQWRRWCLDPGYAVGAEGAEARARFAAVVTPLAAFSFTDDEMMSERSIDSLHGFYAGAPMVRRRFAPADLDVPRVGHFGFFRNEMAAPIWNKHLLPELATRDAA